MTETEKKKQRRRRGLQEIWAGDISNEMFLRGLLEGKSVRMWEICSRLIV